MKLLIDHNLSYRLVAALSARFPGTQHVRQLGLERADDADVWEYAKANGFAVVSKDADFHQLSFAYGHPPKVVWIRLGNCSRRETELLLRASSDAMEAFDADPEASFLAIE